MVIRVSIVVERPIRVLSGSGAPRCNLGTFLVQTGVPHFPPPPTDSIVVALWGTSVRERAIQRDTNAREPCPIQRTAPAQLTMRPGRISREAILLQSPQATRLTRRGCSSKSLGSPSRCTDRPLLVLGNCVAAEIGGGCLWLRPQVPHALLLYNRLGSWRTQEPPHFSTSVISVSTTAEHFALLCSAVPHRSRSGGGHRACCAFHYGCQTAAALRPSAQCIWVSNSRLSPEV